MKKFFITALVVMTGVCSAKESKPVLVVEECVNLGESATTAKSNVNSYKEIKIVFVNGLDTCYVRECKTGERDNGDGTTTEIKVCGPWEQVPCRALNLQLKVSLCNISKY